MNKLLLIIPLVIAAFAIYFLFFSTRIISLSPSDVRDSDGKLSADIIRSFGGGGFDKVNLKLENFGYVTVVGWESKTEFSNPKKIFISVAWKTDVKRGAGNIYVGYSNDSGSSFTELGPFNESESVQNTTIEINGPFSYDVKRLQVRWRGNDTDLRLPANGYVNFRMDAYA